VARYGEAGRDMAWLGPAGFVGPVWFGVVGHGVARHGLLRKGVARRGEAWSG